MPDTLAKRSEAVCRRGIAWAAALGLWLPVAAAQTSLDPELPAASPPSRVRGLATPGDVSDSSFSPAGMLGAAPASFGGPADPVEVAGADASPTTNPVPIDGAEVIARVDGQVVLASDLLWQVNHLIANANAKQVAAGGPPLPEDQIDLARRELIARLLPGLIDTKLLYADFCRKIPAENLPKIEESIGKPFEEIEVPRLIEMLNVKDRTELDAALRRHGTSLKDVQRQFMEKTIATEWLKQRLPKRSPITYEALLAYYQDHPREFEVEAEVDWEELMVRFDRCGGDRREAWRQLCEMGNEVWQSALANPELRGPAFAAVARARSHGATASEGGVHKDTTLGALRCEALNEALATLQIGQMSDGIESEVGFHIVRVLRRTEAGRRPFTEAQGDIRRLLENEQRQSELDAELQKLRSSARAWTTVHGDLSGPQLAELLDESKQRR
ncbi:MAG TPA: peptidylprolyl isomerase [Lacipirellulaceae bacterium]|nr:peptidylprolyl isomerase [Lacipirellulaceae bacterium]